MVVCLGRCADDHLGALAGRGELGSMAVEGQLPFALLARHRDLLYGPEDGVAALVGGEKMEALLAGQLDIDAEAVGEKAHLPDQLRACAGDGLGMDIAAEMVFIPQQPQDGEHPLGGVVGGAQHGAGEEKPLDVVAAIELDGQFGQFARREGGARNVVAAAVDAVGAVVDAIIGKHHFEQGDTTAVLGKTMADAPATHSVPQHTCLAGAHRTTGGARDVILCRLCQYLQFIENVFIHNTCVKSSNNTFQKQKRPPVVAVFRSIKYAFFLTS